ncbi:MAG: FMN-binding protein [Duncaniella sp.]|nr:FMN-binding protein [Duncaniella sp.]
MKLTAKILSLILAILMMAAAAIAVNKKILGHDIVTSVEQSLNVETDTLSLVPGGSAVIHTAPFAKKNIGYAGPVPLDIYIENGKISEIKPLTNSETPSFYKRAEVLFSRWEGLSPKDALKQKVDAVSGATYTSNAIINNVIDGLDFYLGTEAGASTSLPFKMWIALAVTLTACIVPLFVKNRIYNYAQLTANVVVLGFWCGQFLDYSLMLKYLSDGFSMPGAIVAIVMLIAAFIYPLFGRAQHYCNHICPLGAAQILVAGICGYKIRLSARVVKVLDWFRKILWAVLMLMLWTDCLTGWMDLELFQAFQYESAGWGIIIAALAFVALSAIVSRPYCRFVCPTGSLFKRAENIG